MEEGIDIMMKEWNLNTVDLEEMFWTELDEKRLDVVADEFTALHPLFAFIDIDSLVGLRVRLRFD